MNCTIALLVAAFAAPQANANTPFAFRETSPATLELSDGGKPVFVYNFGMILAEGRPKSMERSCYLHPVYAPNGAMVTDDFNPNHVHHRGISWTWPVINFDGKHGDIWTVKGPFQERFVAWKARETSGPVARLAVENGWFDGERKFVKEDVEILTHPVANDQRLLEFTLRFEATGKPVEIAGTPEGKKGFGGFCYTLATPDGGGAKTIIRTDEGISKQDGVFAPHPWAQISGVFKGQAAGCRVEDDPSNPGYPKNGWLMRHVLHCLNVSYPGMTPITLEPGKPLVLKYKTILFSGEDLPAAK